MTGVCTANQIAGFLHGSHLTQKLQNLALIIYKKNKLSTQKKKTMNYMVLRKKTDWFGSYAPPQTNKI